MKGIQKVFSLMFLIFGLVYAAEETNKSSNNGNGGSSSDSQKEESKEKSTESSSLKLGTSLLGLASILAICLAK
ncbi:uncharacterized protein Eint_010435 [Encephalitozoon intestinalis ATCC 50506]|uniref:Uncharacterized protein n=1 Tax=Encephalitozoon intestinalis (strain ATCC 50506) TaxID=876142 RepID=W8Q1S6_ENCIT|nr:uncharacterized protein Eint_010435 [Encephalitozoon intestinalis ATCC 50506]AHL30069.1 hypothetical protein Eint_010435 [Encephalitozoon intestinalis ATCC 50506]UTX44540.1 hypothetical protein GPK93_01g00490 [Encephalitozoon intestinalis]